MAASVLGILNVLIFCRVEKSCSSAFNSGLTFSSLTLTGGGGGAATLYSGLDV